MADVGYIIKLDDLQFDESSNTSWIQAFPYGKYDHPIYGDINFNDSVAKEAVNNFNANVRGTEIDIDYDHKMHTGAAAGWVRKVEARSNGLFILVEWTQKAIDAIRNKEYKYFSPEFADEWKHPKTGQVVKNILFGGGITNRPFLKDILPLNMSELGMPSEHPQEGKGMDPEKLRELLGLPKDATDEQVETALKERAEKSNEDDGNEGGEQPEPGSQQVREPIAASEGLPKEVIQLAESNPAIKALVDSVTALGTELKTTQKALRLSEVESTVLKLSEGKNALPSSVQDQLKKILMETDPQTANAIVGMFTELQGTGLVALGEIGQQRRESESDPGKAFSDEVAKVMNDDKLDYGDAVARVSQLRPDLYESYRNGSYAFKEN